MAPSISPFPQCLWASTKDVLQGAPLLAQLARWGVCHSPTMQIGWAGENIINWLNGKRNVEWFGSPELWPGELVRFCMLPSSPGSLFTHADHLASAFFLHLCSYLIVYQLELLLSKDSAYHGLEKLPSPACPTATMPIMMLCHSRAINTIYVKIIWVM